MEVMATKSQHRAVDGERHTGNAGFPAVHLPRSPTGRLPLLGPGGWAEAAGSRAATRAGQGLLPQQAREAPGSSSDRPEWHVSSSKDAFYSTACWGRPQDSQILSPTSEKGGSLGSVLRAGPGCPWAAGTSREAVCSAAHFPPSPAGQEETHL